MNKEARINNRLPFAREGFPFIFMGIGITIFFAWLGLATLTIIAGAIALFVLYFFRDPERRHSGQKNAVMTPADGRVLEIKKLEGTTTLLANRPSRCLFSCLSSMFMSTGYRFREP